MTEYPEPRFPIECKGRDSRGKEVLDEAVKVEVRVSSLPPGLISLDVMDCPHNTGGHGQRCKASHPETDKVGKGVICPYSVDIPYALDHRRAY